ncbi:MAG: tetraacyldisaccharide 4'-kinase [Pseudomonadota bacterium]
MFRREPWFWRDDGATARAFSVALAPAGRLAVSLQRARRRRARPARCAVPVFCVGAATLGGVGKTPFALLIHRLLTELGVNAHFLTRGYGGRERGPLRVDPGRHDAGDVGDEALLLARAGPVFVSRRRPEGAAAAAAAGAQAIVMDDGYQNPSLAKTASFLLLANDDPAGNGRPFPAGPLREPIADAAARADVFVVVKQQAGDPIRSETRALCRREPVGVWLEPATDDLPEAALAFCGVGAPARFFATARACGVRLVEAVAFPDHYPYTAGDIARLAARAEAAGVPLLTTEKDAARLGADTPDGLAVLPVRMACDAPARLRDVFTDALGANAVGAGA